MSDHSSPSPAKASSPTRMMAECAPLPPPRQALHLYGATSYKMETHGFSVPHFLKEVKGFDKGQLDANGTGSLQDGHGNCATIAKVNDPALGVAYSTVNFATRDGCPAAYKPGTITYLVMEDIREDNRMGGKVREMDAISVMVNTITNGRQPGAGTFKQCYAAAKEEFIRAEFDARRDASRKAAMAAAQQPAVAGRVGK